MKPNPSHRGQPRSWIDVRQDVTVKRHRTVEAAKAEAAWFAWLPWACPELLDVDGPTLTMRTLPVASDLDGWKPAAELAELLCAIHREGVHHRDVHVGNVVQDPSGPLLIDWECAIWMPSDLSYDLHGPEASGVPKPAIHAGLQPCWWYGRRNESIYHRWGAHHGV